MIGPKFDWSINLGHILMFGSIVAAAVASYATYRVTINDMESRLKNLEKWQVEQSDINNRMTQTLYRLREDVAVIRDRLERAAKWPTK